MKYDVVVIGAGIQGAGVAQACAAAGYTVLVIEKTAPAAGTSSKSSKLIHGGLRYLETAQFGLVRESLQERALLLKLAPELVSLKPLHIPLYETSTRSPLTIRAGLSLYSALSGFDPSNRFKSLSRKQWGDLSGLNTKGLRAVFRYHEAQTDDAALTRAVLHSATQLGAEVRLATEFVGADIGAERVSINVVSQSGESSVECRVLVNCAGPWVEKVINRFRPSLRLPPIELVQGSHLLLPPLLNQYFYFESPSDGRAIFVLPYQQQLMIGTTERIFLGDPETCACTQDEQAYLLATLNHYFPHLLYHSDQIQHFAGLRVLPKSDKSAFSRPRDVMIYCDNEERPKVVSVMGGKLTTYRATADQVLNRLRASLPERGVRGDTRKLHLNPIN